MTKLKLNQRVLYPGITIDYDWELTAQEWIDKIGYVHFKKLSDNGWFDTVPDKPKAPMYLMGFDTQLYTKEDMIHFNKSCLCWDAWHRERYGV